MKIVQEIIITKDHYINVKHTDDKTKFITVNFSFDDIDLWLNEESKLRDAIF